MCKLYSSIELAEVGCAVLFMFDGVFSRSDVANQLSKYSRLNTAAYSCSTGENIAPCSIDDLLPLFENKIPVISTLAESLISNMRNGLISKNGANFADLIILDRLHVWLAMVFRIKIIRGY